MATSAPAEAASSRSGFAVPEVLLGDVGLAFPGHQRLLEEQPLGPEREKCPGHLQTLLLAGEHEHRLRLPPEQFVERAGHRHPESLA